MAVVVLAVVCLGLAVWYRDTKTTAAGTKTRAVIQDDGTGASPKVILATKIELVDSSGSLSGYWSAEDPNGPEFRIVTGYLSIKDEEGKLCMVMVGDKEGSWLSLYDENGKRSAMLSASKEGSALALWDQDGKARAGLGGQGDDGAAATRPGRQAAPRAWCVVQGWVTLVLFDQDGMPRLSLKHGPSDFSDHNKLRHKIPAFADKRLSEGMGRNIETLVNCRIAGLEPDVMVNQWIETVPDSLLKKFVSGGLIDGQRTEITKPLTSHISDYAEILEAKGYCGDYVVRSKNRLRKITAACRFSYFRDITQSAGQPGKSGPYCIS